MHSSHRYPKTRINDPPMQYISITPTIQIRKHERPIQTEVPTDDKNNLIACQVKTFHNSAAKLNSQRVVRFQGSPNRTKAENLLKPSEMKSHLSSTNHNLSKAKERPSPISVPLNKQKIDASDLKKTDDDDAQSPKQTKYCANCKFFLQVLKHYNKKFRTYKSLEKNEIDTKTVIKPIPKVTSNQASPKKNATISSMKLEQNQIAYLQKRTQSTSDDRDETITRLKEKSSPKRKKDTADQAKQSEASVTRNSRQKSLDLKVNQETVENKSGLEKHHQLVKIDYSYQQSLFKSKNDTKISGHHQELNIQQKLFTQPSSESEQEKLNSTSELLIKDSQNLECRMREVSSELKQTKEKLDLLTKEKQNWIFSQTVSTEKLQDDLIGTTELLKEKDQTISTLRSENIALQLKYEQAFTDHQMVVAQVTAQYVEKIKELETLLLNSRSEQSRLIEKLAIVSNLNSDLESRRAESQRLLLQEQRRLSSMHEEIRNSDTMKGETQSKHSILLEAKDSEISSSHIEIKKLREQLSDQSTSYQQELARAKITYEAELNLLCQQLTDLNSQQTSEKAEVSQKLNVYDKDLLDLQEVQKYQEEQYKIKNEELLAEIKHLRAQNDSLIESLNSLKRELALIEASAAQEKLRHSLTYNQNEAQNQRLEELETQIKREEAEIQRLTLQARSFEEMLKTTEENQLSLRNTIKEELKLFYTQFLIKATGVEDFQEIGLVIIFQNIREDLQEILNEKDKLIANQTILLEELENKNKTLSLAIENYDHVRTNSKNSSEVSKAGSMEKPVQANDLEIIQTAKHDTALSVNDQLQTKLESIEEENASINKKVFQSGKNPLNDSLILTEEAKKFSVNIGASQISQEQKTAENKIASNQFNYQYKYVTLDHGETIAYVEDGPLEPHSTIIALHANSTNSYVYYDFMKRIKEFTRVIALDLRGHGKSSYKMSFESLDDLANDVIAFISKLEIKNVSLIGWSLGGGVCLAVAKNAPKLVNKIVLHASIGLRGIRSEDEDIELEEYLENPGVEAFLEGIQDGNIEFIAETYEPFKRILGEQKFKEYCELILEEKATLDSFRAIGNTDLFGEVKSIKAKMLILHGSKDEVYPLNIPRETAATFGDSAKLQIWENIGHMLLAEDPQRFFEEVRLFLL